MNYDRGSKCLFWRTQATLFLTLTSRQTFLVKCKCQVQNYCTDYKTKVRPASKRNSFSVRGEGRKPKKGYARLGGPAPFTIHILHCGQCSTSQQGTPVGLRGVLKFNLQFLRSHLFWGADDSTFFPPQIKQCKLLERRVFSYERNYSTVTWKFLISL